MKGGRLPAPRGMNSSPHPLQTGLPIHSPAAGQLRKEGATLPDTARAPVHRD